MNCSFVIIFIVILRQIRATHQFISSFKKLGELIVSILDLSILHIYLNNWFELYIFIEIKLEKI